MFERLKGENEVWQKRNHRLAKIQIAGSEKRNPRAKRHPGQRKRKDSERTGDSAFLSPFHSTWSTDHVALSKLSPR